MFSRRKQGTKDEPGSFGQQGENTTRGEKDGDENTSTNKTIVPSLLTAAAKTSFQALALDGSLLDPANKRPMSRRKDKGSTLGQTSRVPVCLAACVLRMWKDCGW
jgi:hypothetical protein